MSEEEAIEIVKKYLNFNEICGTRNFKEALEMVFNRLKKKDKRIAELEEENTEMKNLFRIQASIAKELEFEERDKIIKFRNVFYAPYTMQITDDIEKGKRIDLSYVDITKLLEKAKK